MADPALHECPMPASENPHTLTGDRDLPEFERPPVAEVVLGIQFDPLVGMSAAHMGSVWARFRGRFPRTEDHPQLAAVFERFGAPGELASFPLNLDIALRPAPPRCWFVSSAGDELVQLQQDRFVHNWRAVDGQTTYPRYSALRKSFEEEVRLLGQCLKDESIGELVPNQCEVSYINHIVAGERWKEHREVHAVFPMLAPVALSGPWSTPEEVRLDMSYLMKVEDEPKGRLRVSIAPGFMREGSKPMFAMTLTARGEPLGDGISGALAFLDLGHEWIVRGFDALTSEAMHITWGKRSR